MISAIKIVRQKTLCLKLVLIVGLGWLFAAVPAYPATGCTDNLTVTVENNTYCANYFPELPKLFTGKHYFQDAAFSHPSLHVSASQKSCGGAVGFAWGAGDKTGQKSIEYCEIKLSKLFSEKQISQMGCKCEVYLVPGKTRGNFVLIQGKAEFLSTFNLTEPQRQLARQDTTSQVNTTVEAKKQRLAQAEATARLREQAKQLAAVEAEKQRLAQAEATARLREQAKQLAAVEAEKQRLAQAEATARLREQAKQLAAREAELALLRAKLSSNSDSARENPPASAGTGALKLGAIGKSNPRKALVIGNDSYSHVSALRNAVADAKAMAKQLGDLGYAVTTSFDSPRRKMLETIRNFSYSVEGGDEVVFFYAGHGVELSGQNYLLPVDIRGDDPRQVQDDAIELQRVLNDMSQSRAKFTLAVVDACRDNPFKSTGRAIGGRGLAPTTAATGQMVIFSAGSGQQALDRLDEKDNNPNGLFTRVFVEEMGRPNVPIDRVVKVVRKRVVDMAATVGHAQVPAIYDQVIGDFFFVKR